MELGMEDPAKNTQLTGMLKEQYNITMPLIDGEKVLELFKNSGECYVNWVLRNRRGGLEQGIITWLGKPRGNANLQSVCGKFVISGRYLVVCADSLKQLKGGKDFYLDNIAALLGEGGYGADGYDSQAEESIETFSWPAPRYAAVAVRVKEGLAALGFDRGQQRGAMQLWYDFCSKEQPAIRKAAVWAATVIYAFTRLEKEEKPKQQDLAGEYGVSSSSISAAYKLLRRSLELVAFDKRYSTKASAYKGYRG
jgi:hypothetical protein